MVTFILCLPAEVEEAATAQAKFTRTKRTLQGYTVCMRKKTMSMIMKSIKFQLNSKDKAAVSSCRAETMSEHMHTHKHTLCDSVIY